jgi:hypothetical protein
MNLHTSEGRTLLVHTIDFLRDVITADVPAVEPVPVEVKIPFLQALSRREKKHNRKMRQRQRIEQQPRLTPIAEEAAVKFNVNVRKTSTKAKPKNITLSKNALVDTSYLMATVGVSSSTTSPVAKTNRLQEAFNFNNKGTSVGTPPARQRKVQPANISVLAADLVGLLDALDSSAVGDNRGRATVSSAIQTVAKPRPTQPNLVTQSGVPIECPICYEQITTSNHLVLTCVHHFHETCITTVLRSTKIRHVCPVCKTPLPQLHTILNGKSKKISDGGARADCVRH